GRRCELAILRSLWLPAGCPPGQSSVFLVHSSLAATSGFSHATHRTANRARYSVKRDQRITWESWCGLERPAMGTARGLGRTIFELQGGGEGGEIRLVVAGNGHRTGARPCLSAFAPLRLTVLLGIPKMSQRRRGGKMRLWSPAMGTARGPSRILFLLTP